MRQAGAGGVMLVGEAAAVLDLAGCLARTPRARLSVDAAGAALRRLDLCGATPPVAVTLSLDMEQVRARLSAPDTDARDTVDRLVGHTLAEVGDVMILRTLAAQRGRRIATAAMLGIPPHRLRARLRRIGRGAIKAAAARPS